jgi:hypothetical protein
MENSRYGITDTDCVAIVTIASLIQFICPVALRLIDKDGN